MKTLIITQIKNAVSILRLNKEKMLEVSQNKNATIWGIAFLVLPVIINLILMAVSFPSGFGVIFSRFMLWPMLVPVISIAGSVFLMSFLAEKFFKGVKDHLGFFRTVSYAGIALWASIIPFLLFGILDQIGLFNLIMIAVGVWMLAVSYHMLLIQHKIKPNEAMIVIVGGVIGYLILTRILGLLLIGDSFRMWY